MSERRSAPSPSTPDAAPAAASPLDAEEAGNIIRRESTDPEAIENAVANPDLGERQQAIYDRETSRVVLRWDRELRRGIHEEVRLATWVGEQADTVVGDFKHQMKDDYHNGVINGLTKDYADHNRNAQTAVFEFRRRGAAAKARRAKRQLHIANSFQAAERKRYDAIISHDVAIRKPVTEVNKTYVEVDGRYIPFKKARQDNPDKYKNVQHGDFYKDEAGVITSIKDGNGNVIERVVGVEHIAGSREKRHDARDAALRMRIDNLISAQLKLKEHGKEVRERRHQNSANALRAKLATEGIMFSTEHMVQLRRETLDKLGSNPKMIRVAKKLLANGLESDYVRELRRALEDRAA